MSDKITVLNTLTGQVGKIRTKLFNSPIFNRGNLVEVDPEQKPYVADLWKPRTADEYLAQREYVRVGDVSPVTLPEDIDEEEDD